MTKERGLSPVEEAAARARVEGLSQTDAFKAANPRAKKWSAAAVYVNASQLFSRHKVQLRIKELQDEAAKETILKLRDVQLETRRLMLATPAKLMRREKGQDGKERAVFLMPDELDADTAAAIASFEIDDLGRVKYKFWSKPESLALASRLMGYFERDNAQKNPAQAMWDMLVQAGKAKAEAQQQPGAGMIFKPLPSAALPDDVIDMEDGDE